MFETSNANELLVFTDMQKAYKIRLNDIEDAKSSTLGVYLPAKLEFDDEEKIAAVFIPGDYSINLAFIYENGKIAKVPLTSYATKSNRRKLLNAYSDKSTLLAILPLETDKEIVLRSSDDRVLIFNTSLVPAKNTRNTEGVYVFSKKNGRKLIRACFPEDLYLSDVSRYRSYKIPASGCSIVTEDLEEKQLSLIDGSY